MNRRELLSTVLSPAKVMVPPALSHSSVEINDKCIGCNVCEAVCIWGAIKRLEYGNSVSIILSPGKCNGCGKCERACIFHGIKVTGESRRDRSDACVALLEFETRDCVSCGDRFRDTGGDTCPFCARKKGRLAGIQG